MSKLELVEDIFIVLDLVVSFVAAILKGKGFIKAPDQLFLVGGFFLFVAVVAMICKRVFKK
jgi:hypothetical protein